jgi:hypothetical protein
MLPQIRTDDVEAESCLNVTAMIICPNNLHLIIICRLGTYVFGLRCYRAADRPKPIGFVDA